MGSEAGAKTRAYRSALHPYARRARNRFVRPDSRSARPPGDQNGSGGERSNQYFRNEVTGVGVSFSRPCRNSNSIRKIASTNSPPTFLINVAAEAEVPPVA